jgi:flagellar basal-body rod modification protein FlgD
MDVNALTALSDLGQASKAKNTIAGSFDTFLSLLTTQLKNQNPLEPLNTNEFTAQLVQFAGVEQGIQTNQNLENLLSLTTASTLTGAVGFIGKAITAEGVTAEFDGAQAAWSYSVPKDSPDAEVTIFNSAGQVVFNEKTTLEAGNQTLTWTGRTADGTQAPAGTYRVAITAKDVEGNAMTVNTTITGIVDGVDMTESEPYLTVNGNKVKFSAVKSVIAAP